MIAFGCDQQEEGNGDVEKPKMKMRHQHMLEAYLSHIFSLIPLPEDEIASQRSKRQHMTARLREVEPGGGCDYISGDLGRVWELRY